MSVLPRVVDEGHLYTLLTLDGDGEQLLRFVKREGVGYPGNVGSYAGTNLQSVLRACINRVQYLQGQIACEENQVIRELLLRAVYLLEVRAARRHGMVYPEDAEFAYNAPLCSQCGHTICNHVPLIRIEENE